MDATRQHGDQIRLDVEAVDNVGPLLADPRCRADREPRQIPPSPDERVERRAGRADALVEEAAVSAEEGRDGNRVSPPLEAAREGGQRAVDASAQNRTRDEDDPQQAATLTA